MKILVCNKFYRPVGGPETIVLDTVRELETLGHDVIPFAMAHPDNADSKYAEYFVPNVDYNAEGGKGPGKQLREAANIIYSREARRNIEKLIADTRPDLAHVHNIYHQLSPSILAPIKEAGIPTILTLHDYKLLCANMLLLTHGRVCEKCAGRKFHHAVLNKCVKDSYGSSLVCCIEETLHRALKIYERNVDLFVSPSRFLKGKLVEHGRLKEDQIAVLPNYADTQSLVPDFQPGAYGLFVGHLSRHKGVMTLLEACKEIPDLEVRFAGRGPLLEEAEQFREREGLTKVKFVGFQTGSDLARLFREARFVVLPSECNENCPMAILEAFAYGKPVIASRIGGIPELIDEGSDGLLFEPGDSHELASHMKTLISKPELAGEMGRWGRAKVEEHYSIRTYIESLLGLYSRVLGSRSPGVGAING